MQVRDKRYEVQNSINYIYKTKPQYGILLKSEVAH